MHGKLNMKTQHSNFESYTEFQSQLVRLRTISNFSIRHLPSPTSARSMATRKNSDPSFSSSSSAPRWKYDVFLSFRGEDTRKNFTDHLCTALIHAGIHTFRDNDELPRGEDISSIISRAIQESRIAIVVFSKGYASSTWCLGELSEILACKRVNGQIVVPIFYDIDPSDVRKQTASFAEAFKRHEERFKENIEMVNKWRKVLVEAANLSGWHLQEMENGHEAKFIEKMVEDVLHKLNCKYLTVASYPVGIDSRVKDVVSLLSIYTDDVRTVGIYGMGGIGKTTIAKAVFNQLCNEFEGSCCLLNIKEISEQPNGLVQLQEQLISDLIQSKTFKINNVDRGSALIKERLCHRRVLVVLDDLDQLKQLGALMGERNWFGLGSRVIITTRDEHLLTQLHVDNKYLVEELNHDESLQLFIAHAFKENRPTEELLGISNGVVQYVGGLPLALEVLGSYLCKRSIGEWRSAVKKLKKIPHHQIQRKLQISFNALEDDDIKGIFLDIACFFIGMDVDYVSTLLDGCGFHSRIGIEVLMQRSFITTNWYNKLRMHDLLRDMGREIIREMSPNHPGKRSRLWFQKDVLDVLRKKMGTKAVEGIALDLQASKDVVLSTESFAEMRCLRLLQMNAAHVTGCYEHFPKELAWLCWHQCPLKSLPRDFQLDNVVVLDMQYSNIREVWKGIKFLNRLKILNLSYSVHLSTTPHFMGLPCLERIILEGCTSLVEVHQSIGHLDSLTLLNLEGCKSLKNLPESICYLKCLETLNISRCINLEKLPEQLGDMEALTMLLADGTAIERLPSSIGHLENLNNLSLGGFKYDLSSVSWFSHILPWLSPRISNPRALLPTFTGLNSLRRLDLSYCGLSDGTDLGGLSSLQELNFTRNKFNNLPNGIDRLPKLQVLCLYHCADLLSISDLPSSLHSLMVYHCTSMERLSIQSKNVPDMYLVNCQQLADIQGLGSVGNKPLIYVDNCRKLANNFKKSLLQASFKGEHLDICLRDSEIPDWFSHRGDGSSISFYVPDSEIQGLIVWIVCGASERRLPLPYASATIRNKSKDVRLFHWSTFIPLYYSKPEYHSWVNYVTFSRLPCAMEGGEEVELSVKITNGVVVVKCGVHLISKE